MEAFEKIYSEYYPMVHAYIYRLCQNEELADEITQETFYKVLRKSHTYRGECKLSVWICQIAKNELYTCLKKNKRFADHPMETIAQENEFEQALANKDMALRVHEVLHTLDEPFREVFYLRVFAELSFREIGHIHKKTENWARVTYHRAKLKVKEGLE